MCSIGHVFDGRGARPVELPKDRDRGGVFGLGHVPCSKNLILFEVLRTSLRKTNTPTIRRTWSTRYTLSMKNFGAGVLTVLLFLGLFGACANAAKDEPPPEPKFKVTWTPRPLPREYIPPPPVSSPATTDEPGDVYVDVDHEDDDRRGNSRWCPTRFC